MREKNGFILYCRCVKSQFSENPDLAESRAKRGREIKEEKFDVHMANAVILNLMGLV